MIHRSKPAERPLQAVVSLPGSKSITNRALAAAALARGTSRLSNVLLAEDTRLMAAALETLGIRARLDEHAARATIEGRGGELPVDAATLFCGNSGTTIRFCTALVATGCGRYTLDGVERMRQRPIAALGDALVELGARVEYAGEPGYPPLTVVARGLAGGKVVRLDSPPSSQLASGLLLAAPRARGELAIEVRGAIPSRPYLAMTVAVLRRFGIDVEEHVEGDGLRYRIPAPQEYRATELTIEPDASSASYFLAAAAVAGGRVSVLHLGRRSIQGDARFVDLLERMGCAVERTADRLSVRGPVAPAALRGIEVDLNDMPDTAPTLAVVALFARGATTIRNVASLRVKETDRIEALRVELTKLGARVETTPDSLTVHPPQRLVARPLDTWDDHRMAMSFAVAGLRIPGLEIRGAECCAKTFPDFFERFERLV